MGKRNYSKEVERGDITVEIAIGEVKKEILKEVRALAGGYSQTIYELVQHGKVLLQLEEQIGKVETGAATPKKAAKVVGRGIKAVSDGDEDFDDL